MGRRAALAFLGVAVVLAGCAGPDARDPDGPDEGHPPAPVANPFDVAEAHVAMAGVSWPIPTEQATFARLANATPASIDLDLRFPVRDASETSRSALVTNITVRIAHREGPRAFDTAIVSQSMEGGVVTLRARLARPLETLRQVDLVARESVPFGNATRLETLQEWTPALFVEGDVAPAGVASEPRRFVVATRVHVPAPTLPIRILEREGDGDATTLVALPGDGGTGVWDQREAWIAWADRDSGRVLGTGPRITIEQEGAHHVLRLASNGLRWDVASMVFCVGPCPPTVPV